MLQIQGLSTGTLSVWKAEQVPWIRDQQQRQPKHDLALQESPEGVQFRERLALRERARKAFSEVDNMQSLRRAMQQRSRPQRSVYLPGDWSVEGGSSRRQGM